MRAAAMILVSSSDSARSSETWVLLNVSEAMIRSNQYAHSSASSNAILSFAMNAALD